MSVQPGNNPDALLDMIITQATLCKAWPAYKKALITNHLIETLSHLNTVQELDTSLQEYMNESNTDGTLMPYDDFQNKMEDIEDDSLIIYIKKAQLFKVYNSNKLDEFERDNGTHFHKPEHGPTYEVVRDSHPQKLMIVVNDDIKNEKLEEIKKHIVEFIKINPAFSKTTVKDLKVYNNDNNTEFVVSSMRLKNMSGKEEFIENFIRFMQKRGNSDLAQKIQIRTPPSEINGARFYKLPSSKVQIGAEGIDNILDHLISTSSQASNNITINCTIINSNSNNHNNNNLMSTTTNNISSGSNNTVIASSTKTLKSFYQFICNNKPAWFKEGTLVDIKVIESAYREYFEDDKTTTSVLSRQLNGKLFTDGNRVNKVVKKKLVKYSDLKKLI